MKGTHTRNDPANSNAENALADDESRIHPSLDIVSSRDSSKGQKGLASDLSNAENRALIVTRPRGDRKASKYLEYYER